MSEPLGDGDRRVYIPMVKDTGPSPKNDGHYFHVVTRDNPDGEYATRAWAQDALDRALANDKQLVGFVDTGVVHTEPTLATINISKWLTGNVVPVASVPSKYRDNYHDTLRRGALAAYRYGHVVHVNDSFRTLADQTARWNAYQAGGALAARPGTSNHERGLALDIPNARNTPGLIKHLRELKLVDDIPSEIWHVTNHARA